MNRYIFYILSFIIWVNILTAQSILIQPTPKKMILENRSIIFTYDNPLYIIAKNGTEKKAAEYFKYLSEKKIQRNVIISTEDIDTRNWIIIIKQNNYLENFPNDQYYNISFHNTENEITIESPGQLGLLYGVVTFLELMTEENGSLKIEKCSIQDGPTYRRRLFVADPTSQDIPSLFDWALQNKLETIVIASRRHPWYEISDEYMKILKEIKKWRDRFGGPEVMQSHNIYEGKNIIISDEQDIHSLMNVIKTSYEHGINKLMILSDDTPLYKFGEGYILTNESDKKVFEHFEAANTFLMNKLVNWFKEEDMNIESYYVPAFYTYEEMHQGDMSLYLDTPWEDAAFNPFFRDLEYLGKNLDESIYIVWCGPYVRSRKITMEDFNDWTENLSGRIPFLWDNTIYSHYPFTSTSMLTAWDNELPPNFENITAGNGMFINNDANSETGIVGGITTNDYLWNPKTYNPNKTLESAIIREYGQPVKDLVFEFKETELAIREKIGERNLWYQADSLWQQIRKTRFITDKNPFYYHLNYSRLKALRLQLKASVPEPSSDEEYEDELKKLYEKRDIILSKIKANNLSSYIRLIKMAKPKDES